MIIMIAKHNVVIDQAIVYPERPAFSIQNKKPTIIPSTPPMTPTTNRVYLKTYQPLNGKKSSGIP
jgi:hypothetical protein